MATRDEIIDLIRNSPLTDEDLRWIMQHCVQITMGNALMGAGMDLLAESVRDVSTTGESNG